MRKILNIVKRFVFPACDIPFSAQIGDGSYFPHRAIGVIIHSSAIIGMNAKIETGVVIGGRNGRGAPTIGDNVFIGTGAAILGDVHIGDDVMIGAGAVVLDDIESGCVVAGVPAKKVKKVPKELLGKMKN